MPTETDKDRAAIALLCRTGRFAVIRLDGEPDTTEALPRLAAAYRVSLGQMAMECYTLGLRSFAAAGQLASAAAACVVRSMLGDTPR